MKSLFRQEESGSVRGSRHPVKVKNPARYRLDFIKENTFNRLWSVRFTRSRVWLASAAIVCALGALIYVVLAFTPARILLPERITPATRAAYLEQAMQLDSLQQRVENSTRYARAVRAIMDGEPVDSVSAGIVDDLGQRPDSAALSAREAEKRFVKAYENAQNYNLSVLAPIAAEAMAFGSPVGNLASQVTEADPDALAIYLSAGRYTPATAVYTGSVLAVIPDAEGLSTVIVQHPGGFVSVYGNLSQVFVEKGSAVRTGTRLGHTPDNAAPLFFELWLNGSRIPAAYIRI